MKIVIMASPTYDSIGGVSTHVYMLEDGLRKLGNDVIIISSDINKYYKFFVIDVPGYIIKKFNVILKHRYCNMMQNFYYFVVTLIKCRKIDVLNIQGVIYSDIAMVIKKHFKCKVILTVHGYITYEMEQA